MRETDLQIGLASYDGLMKRSYAYIVRNTGKIIALITALISVMVTFTDISFCSFSAESFTSTLLLMLTSSYLIYFSLEDAGEKLGEESEQYLSAKQNFDAVKSAVAPTDIIALRRFCADYCAEELLFRQTAFLGSHGYSCDDLYAYKNGANFPKSATRVLKKALKMKPCDLTPPQLLSGSKTPAKGELQSPARGKFFATVTRLLPSTVCTLFTVSIMLTAKDGLTPEAIVSGLLKLSALPIVGFKGYSAGYAFAKDTRAAYLEAKSRLLANFLAKKSEKN